MDEEEILTILALRGVRWLHRMMRVLSIHSRSELWGVAIRDDFKELQELGEALHETEGFFVFDVVTVTKCVAGCDDSVEKLERWSPVVLDWDFLNAGEDYWDQFMTIACRKKDVPLAQALLKRTRVSQLYPHVLLQWEQYVRCDGDRDEVFLAALNACSDKMQELRQCEDPDFVRMVRRYKRMCRKSKRDPHPDVIAHLATPIAKSAIL